LASVNLNVQKRCLSQTVSVAKQLPKTDPRNDSAGGILKNMQFVEIDHINTDQTIRKLN